MEATNERKNTVIRVRPATRSKYNRVKQIKGLPYCEVAERAVESLIRTDPELKPMRSKQPA